MTLYDVLDYREPEPRPARCAAAPGIGPVEPPGEVWKVLGGDAVAFVGHGQNRDVPLHAEVDGYGSIVRPVLECVVDQITHELLELLGVPPDLRPFRQRKFEPIETLKPGGIARGTLGQASQVHQRGRQVVLFGFDPR